MGRDNKTSISICFFTGSVTALHRRPTYFHGCAVAAHGLCTSHAKPSDYRLSPKELLDPDLVQLHKNGARDEEGRGA